MKKAILPVLMAGCLLAAMGCTGPFMLTKKVHNWQTGLGDKWVEEVAFLGCVIFPVYSLSCLADAIIFNSVEFWTGENPMANVNVSDGGENANIALQSDDTIRISNGQETIVLERTENGVIAKDSAGNITHRAIRGADGTVRVYDADGKLIQQSRS